MESNANLEKAKKNLQIADHLIYMTYPLLKEQRLLIKILEELYGVLSIIINAVLQHEYMYKRIRLYSDEKSNFSLFGTKCAERYGITQEQVKNIQKIFYLIEKHKKSPMEFIRNNKFIIMSDNLKTESVALENLKEYLMVGLHFIFSTNIG